MQYYYYYYYVILYNFWKEDYVQGEGVVRGYIDKWSIY